MKTGIGYFLIAIISLSSYSCTTDENLTHELIGKWKWAYMCGGFTGACEYADKNETRALEFTINRMIETSDGGLVTTTVYTVSSKTVYEDHTEYMIQLENGISSRIKATKNTLDIENGDTWTGYKK